MRDRRPPERCQHCASALFRRALQIPHRWVCDSCGRFQADGYQLDCEIRAEEFRRQRREARARASKGDKDAP